MATPIKQSSFAGGEFAPGLWARTDLEKYASAVRRAENFVVRPHGGLTSRPGLRFVHEVKASSRKVRLLPFAFSNRQTYVIELGHLYARFYSGGGILLDPATEEPYEIVTPWAEDDLDRVKYAQLGDVITLVHPSYPPRELRRYGHVDWRLSTLTVVRKVQPPTNVALLSSTTNPNPDDSHPFKDWSVAVTSVSADGEESLPSVVCTANVNLYSDRPATWGWHAPASGAAVEHYNVYRGRNGVLGFIGSSTATTFRDDGQVPTTTDAPPTGRDPFDGPGKYPSCVTYFEGRRVFARSDGDPQNIWATATGNYSNWDVCKPAKDNDAITITLGSRAMDEIRNLVPTRVLLTLTGNAEWAVQGAGGGTLTPSSYEMRPQSYRGSSWLDPISVGNVCLYVQERGNVVRDLAYSYQDDGYTGDDLTVLASHLFEGHEIVDWAFQQIPWSVVWCVRDDGVLLSLTYLKEHQVYGWTRHATDGVVERVCSVPEGREDALYLLVRRTVEGVERRYVERMASSLIGDVRDVFRVDSGLSYDGRAVGATIRLFGGTDWAAGETFTAQASAPSFALSHVGGQVVLETAPRVRLTIVGFETSTQVRVRAESPVPSDARDVARADWSLALARFGGLSHLEGRTVSVLADGCVHPPAPVKGGAIELQYPAAVVHAGLGYVCELETLDLAVPGEAVATVQKVVPRVFLEVEAARGLSVGEPGERMRPWKRRRASDGYDEPERLATELVEVPIASAWNTAGRVAVRLDDPLPLTVLSVIREVSGGR